MIANTPVDPAVLIRAEEVDGELSRVVRELLDVLGRVARMQHLTRPPAEVTNL